MDLFHTTRDEIHCFPVKTDLLHENRAKSGIRYGFDKNCLNHDSVYLKGDHGSCYWIDSQGLTIQFCDVISTKDISLGDINLTLSSALESVSSFDGPYVMSFAEILFSKIRDVFDMSRSPDGTIDLFLGWKSIALLILSSDRCINAEIAVRIGNEDYSIPC